jgi:hypothetical protein
MDEPIRSPWFEVLRASLAAPITRDNLEAYRSFELVDHLDVAERALIEDLLISRLARDDGRAADALATLGTQRARPALLARLAPDVPALMRLAAARALRELGERAGDATSEAADAAGADATGEAAVAEVLRGGAAVHERLSALSALSLWRGAAAERAVAAALEDDDALVRSAATRQLIERRGLGAHVEGFRDRLGLLQNRMASPLPGVRAAARAELDEIFAGYAAGASAEALGLTWRADERVEPLRSFTASLRSAAPPWQHAYALAGVAELPERERRWVEDCLWHWLPSDPRAARALAHLRVRRAAQPLREALALAPPEVAAAIEEALRQLA